MLSVWDWANGNQIHDEISTDRRNPTVNANGVVYGVSPSTGFIQWLDPVKNVAGQIPIPGDGKGHNEYAYPHNPMLDERGRVWVTDSSRGRQISSFAAKGVKLTAPLGVRADYCANEAASPFAKYYPMPGNNTSMAHVYDPATKKIDSVPTCFGTHHLTFGYDQDNTLFFSGDSNVVGLLKTKVYDQTRDLQKAEGWCPMVLDTKERAAADGKITPDRTQWTAPGAPARPGEGHPDHRVPLRHGCSYQRRHRLVWEEQPIGSFRRCPAGSGPEPAGDL